jgi:DUF1016 N-terminal domain
VCRLAARALTVNVSEGPRRSVEISLAKNLLILKQCKDPLQREFYLRATARLGWTKAVLQHQIDGQSYEKYLLTQTSFDQTLPPEVRDQAVRAVGSAGSKHAHCTAGPGEHGTRSFL